MGLSREGRIPDDSGSRLQLDRWYHLLKEEISEEDLGWESKIMSVYFDKLSLRSL